MPTRRDAVAGALALSALGDAMGLPHEQRGLRGAVAQALGEDLPTAEQFREPEPNPWNIWAPWELTKGLRGTVSDDTAVKICLIEPWLATRAADQAPLESDFRRWLPHRHREQNAWREAMAAAMADSLERQWLTAEGQAVDPPAEFREEGAPVNWECFLYGPLPLSQRVSEFDWETYSVLAQGRCHALAELASLFKEELVADAPRRVVADPLQLAQVVGASAWESTVPTTQPLRPFHPGLQIAQVKAWLEVGNVDPLTALRACVLSPGDTDTVAAILGLVLGYRWGLTRLRLDGELAMLLDTVDTATQRLFHRTLAQRISAYGPMES